MKWFARVLDYTSKKGSRPFLSTWRQATEQISTIILIIVVVDEVHIACPLVIHDGLAWPGHSSSSFQAKPVPSHTPAP